MKKKSKKGRGGMQVRKREEKTSKGGEKEVGGWLATRATPGREVLISGWVGYTLTNCLPARRRGSRAEGDLSPLKGLRFCRTPLPHSPFSPPSSPLPRQRPTYISRLLLAPRSAIPFSGILPCSTVHTLSHWGERQIGKRIFHQQQASSQAHIQFAGPSTLFFETQPSQTY